MNSVEMGGNMQYASLTQGGWTPMDRVRAGNAPQYNYRKSLIKNHYVKLIQ